MKVMTLNLNFVESKHGAWSIRKELIADAIAARHPDIIALQAVRKDPAVEGGKDQAAQLVERLPEFAYAAFRPTIDYGNGRQDGSAFLSRIPLEDVGHHKLSILPGAPGEAQDTSPRIVLHARVTAPRLYLFNGHYSWVCQQAALNVEEGLAFMRSFPEPRLLIGDLNTPPESELMKRLAKEGWIDAWAALRPGEAGYTYESNAPDKRIDYVWISQDLRPYVKEVELVTERPNQHGARLSDHIGLLATFEWETNDTAITARKESH